ncbi:MAG TPA: type II secretion system protein GspL [Geobacteraceae bacterium]|nr:type II secretion system protein GspL [Geobacteraceae bacterium]
MNYLIVQLTGNDAFFARFQMKRGALVMESASRETIDHEHPLPSILADAVTASGRKGERVILALPATSLYLREIELPITDRRKIREVLPLEMRGETAFDTEGVVFDSLQLKGGKTLAIWGKRQEMEEMIALMSKSGVEPEIVTASMFSWHHLLPDEARSGQVAITDGEALAVYWDGLPCYFRALPVGELFPQVTRTLSALEIGKGVKVEKVLLHGAAMQKLSQLPDGPPSFTPLPGNREMATVFGGEISAARDLAGSYAVARAVALEESVNFRSGDLAYTAGRRKALNRLRISMTLAAVLLALLIAETSLRYFLVKRDLDSVNSSINAIYREVFPKRNKAVDEVAELRSEIRRVGGGSPSGGVLLALKNLADIKGDDVTGLFEVEMEGDQLRVRGDARSSEAVNGFRNRAASIFASAEVGEIRSKPDGSVAFLFRGAIREGGR